MRYVWDGMLTMLQRGETVRHRTTSESYIIEPSNDSIESLKSVIFGGEYKGVTYSFAGWLKTYGKKVKT